MKSSFSSHKKYVSQDKLGLMIYVYSNMGHWICFNNSEMKNVHLLIATWLDFYPTQIKDLTKGLTDMSDVIFGR